MLKILSLGVGIQSSTILLMALNGEIEMPDYAVFCDTGFEPQGTYDYLEWLVVYCNERDFDIHVAQKKAVKGTLVSGFGFRMVYPLINLKKDALNPDSTARIPFHIKNENGTRGMLPRQCTREFKVDVFSQYVRRDILEMRFREQAKNVLCEKWLGISTGE